MRISRSKIGVILWVRVLVYSLLPPTLLVALLLLAITAGLFAYGAFYPAKTEFRLNAWTRSASIKVADGQPIWPADYGFSPISDGCTPLNFTPVAGSTVTLSQERPDRLSIDVVGPMVGGEQRPAGTFECDQQFEPAPSGPRVGATLIQGARGAPWVIAFRGKATTGAAFAFSNPRPQMLETGVLSMATRGFIARTLGEASRYEFDRGDQVFVSANGGSGDGDIAVGEGVVALKDPADTSHVGFQFVNRAEGTAAFARPFSMAKNAEPVAISPSLGARLRADSEFLFVGPVLVMVIYLMERLWKVFEDDGSNRREASRRLRRYQALQRARSALRAQGKRTASLKAATAAAAAMAATCGQAATGAVEPTPAQIEVAFQDGLVQRGKAVIVQHDGRCVVLTARHTLLNQNQSAGRELQATAATIFADSAPSTGVRATSANAGGDVELMNLDRKDISLCPYQLVLVNVDELLRRNVTDAQVVTFDAAGQTIGRIAVDKPSQAKNFIIYGARSPSENRLVQGVSGAPVEAYYDGRTILIGLVLRVEGDIGDAKAIVVPMTDIVQLLRPSLDALLPRPQITQGPKHLKYDISWLPADARAAILEAQSTASDARDMAARAEPEAAKALANVSGAVAIPDCKDRTTESTYIYFPTDDRGNFITERRLYTQVVTSYNSSGGCTSTPNGTMLSIFLTGTSAGQADYGLAGSGKLRLGIHAIRATSSDLGGMRITVGEFSETGNFSLGTQYFVGEDFDHTDYGRKKDSLIGSAHLKNGRRVDGAWDLNWQPHGYIVSWTPEGYFDFGGKYDHGALVTKFVEP